VELVLERNVKKEAVPECWPERVGGYEPRREALSYKNWKWRPHNCAESFRLWDLRYSNYSGRHREQRKRLFG